MGLFNRGYSEAQKEQERQERNREKYSNRINTFFLTAKDDEATIRFLTEEPVNCYLHSINVKRGGKEYIDKVLCSGDDSCPLCKEGNTPSYSGAFLVVDKRPYSYTDRKGKKVEVDESVKLYIAGTRVVLQLDRCSSKYGLITRDYDVSRTGTGTSVSYSFTPLDKDGKLSKSEIANLLPDKVREMFDGSKESLYEIIESQLETMLPELDDEEDDEREERNKSKNRKSPRSNRYDEEEDEYDDEDEDDDVIVSYDDEDEDDDYEPSSSKKLSRNSMKSAGLKSKLKSKKRT